MPSSPFTSSILGGANNFSTSLYQPQIAVYNLPYNNCSNTLCYTYSKNFIQKPHNFKGSVGRSASGYLSQRKRL